MNDVSKPTQRAPFKFLDPYGPEDRDIYFGRDLEIAEVYARFYRSRTLVVHGESGSGKTSLVQCGLRAKIPSYDALFITVRAALDPLAALRRELLRELAPYIEPNIESVAAPETTLACLERLAGATRKTVVVVFDQFEEFFLFQPHSVRERFIREFAGWSEAEVNARFILCIREEYLARLTEFEAATPDIFRNRLWVRRMSGDQARQAITGPCAACGITAAPELVDELLADLTRGGKGVELPILQVVLDSLYRTELKKKQAATDEKDAALVLSLEAYKAQGKIEAILARFVENAVASHPTPDAARQVLKSLVTSEGTKKVSALSEIEEAVLQFGEPIPTTALETLLRDLINTRVLREDAENHLFELRHDALAATIHDWMTGLEKELMEAREALRGRFRHHEALKKSGGALLDQAFLVYLAPYEPRLKLTGELADYVAASKDEAKKRLRRRRMVLGGIVALAFLVLSGFTAWNVRERKEAKRQEAQAMLALADICSRDGHLAREQHNWGSSLLWYAKSLGLRKTDTARVNAAASLTRFSAELATLRRHTHPIHALAFSPDGQTLASGASAAFSRADDPTVRLWDRASGRELAVLRGHTDVVLALAFSPDGHTIASGSKDRTVRLWDRTGKELAVFEGHTNEVTSLAFSPDGRTLASGSADDGIRLWDRAGAKEPTLLAGHEASVCSVAFSPDGQTLVSGAWDHTVRLWERTSGKELAVLRGHEDTVNCVAFGPDGRTIASGSSDDSIRLWDFFSRESFSVIRGHADVVLSLAFSPDGQTLASGSRDDTIRLWTQESQKEHASSFFSRDVVRHKEQTVLKGHKDTVTVVVFSPDGQALASGAEDEAIRLWDRASGKELAVLRGHENGVNSVAFSPDSQTLASGSSDKTIRFWDLGRGKDFLERLTIAATIGVSYDIDNNGQLIQKDPVTLARARLEAARADRIWWREDGGKSLVPLYENELVQAQAAAASAREKPQ